MSMDFKNIIDAMPQLPGVYKMLNSNGQILYIGKAKRLKTRVSQYFNKNKRSNRVNVMLSHVAKIDYIIVNSEIEALVLENNLIKKYKPPYNVLLKDDKSYAYIKISKIEEYPYLEKVRKMLNDRSSYFGPYMYDFPINKIFEIIYEVFKIRNCKLKIGSLPKNFRPCLEYDINRCTAPCISNVSKDEYMSQFSKVIDFLKGKTSFVKDFLKNKMLQASKLEKYDVAQKFKEYLLLLDNLDRKQVATVKNDENIDIFAIVSKDEFYSISTVFIRNGKLTYQKSTNYVVILQDNKNMLKTFLTQFYKNININTKLILTNIKLGETYNNYLNNLFNTSVKLQTPIKGDKATLMDIALKNASHQLEIHHKKETNKKTSIEVLETFKDDLNLVTLPLRMECYDISHISGTNKVGSMVVFTNGKIDRAEYRIFKIKNVSGNNDFECLLEVLERRLSALAKNKQSFDKKPDLIIIDGGKGQLTYAKKALKEYPDINLISIAEKNEYVYSALDNKEYIFDYNSTTLKLITSIRDEAHRFAIKHHRSLRVKKQTHGVLDQIKGIGPIKQKKLLDTFKDIEGLSKASVFDLEKIKGINKTDAKVINNFFNKNDDKVE